MIFDCFPVCDELDLLLARAYELRNIPDVTHIAVESEITHRGNEKPLHVRNSYVASTVNMKGRLRVHTYTLSPERRQADPWYQERGQREMILDLLGGTYTPKPDDLILVSDVDEIVRESAIPAIREAAKAGPVRLGMRMHYYNFGFYDPNGWAKAVAFYWRDRPHTLEALRMGGSPVVENCGWHLSYFMSPDRIHEKLRNFAHSEYDTPEAHARVENMVRDGVTIHGQQLEKWLASDDTPGWFHG